MAEDAEARLREHLEASLLAVRDEVVLAISEERELVVGNPLEERAHLAALGRVHAAQVVLELAGELERLAAHRLPVPDGRPHLLEHPLDAVVKPLEQLRVRLAHDLGVQHRLRDPAGRNLTRRQHLDDPAVRVAPHADHRHDSNCRGRRTYRAGAP